MQIGQLPHYTALFVILLCQLMFYSGGIRTVFEFFDHDTAYGLKSTVVAYDADPCALRQSLQGHQQRTVLAEFSTIRQGSVKQG